MKYFILPGYSASGCSRPTQLLSVSARQFHSQEISCRSSQTSNGCYHEEVWVQDTFRACPLANSDSQSFCLSSSYPTISGRIQELIPPWQKSHAASGLLAAPLWQRCPVAHVCTWKNTHKAASFLQGETSHRTPRAATNENSQDLTVTLKQEWLQNWEPLSLQPQEKEVK